MNIVEAMSDRLSKARRSWLMSRIKSKGNVKTEQRLASLLRTAKVSGWRRQYPIPGTPDFVFPKSRLAVFVDGCFWHGCPRCQKGSKTNSEFWSAKFSANRRRDLRINQQLRSKGWSVIRVWEHELKRGERVVQRIAGRLTFPIDSGFPQN